MPDDQRMELDVFGSTARPVRLSVLTPLSHTSNAPAVPAANLILTTIRTQVPRVIFPMVPLRPPEPPRRISSFWTNISSQGPDGFSGDHCWNVTFWLWYCQFGGR